MLDAGMELTAPGIGTKSYLVTDAKRPTWSAWVRADVIDEMFRAGLIMGDGRHTSIAVATKAYKLEVMGLYLADIRAKHANGEAEIDATMTAAEEWMKIVEAS
jgi:hypothetical protein